MSDRPSPATPCACGSPPSRTWAASARTTRTPGTPAPGCSPSATASAAPPAATSPRAPRSSSCAGSTSPPAGDDLLGLVAGAIHRAHDRIGELVDEDPALNGTSTTATVALFDGARVGDRATSATAAPTSTAAASSRQLTKDHTFVQTLIDEGRITEEESRVHPHRNLILKAARRHPRGRARPVLRRACRRRPAVPVQRRRLRRARRRPAGRHPRAAAAPTTPWSRWSAPASRPAAPTTSPASWPTSSTAAPPTEPTSSRCWSARPPSCRAAPARGGRPACSAATAPATPASSSRSAPRSPTTSRSRSPATRSTPRRPATPRGRRGGSPGSSGCWRSLVVVGLVWVAAAAAWSWSQDQYYVGEQDGRVVDLPRRQRRPARRLDLVRALRDAPTSSSTGLSDFDAEPRSARASRPAASTTPGAPSRTWPPTGARQSDDSSAEGPSRLTGDGPDRRASWASCTGAAGVRSCSCSSSRSRSASARTPRSASASRARSRPTSSGTAAGWPPWSSPPTSWSGWSRRTPTRCCCRSWPRSTGSASRSSTGSTWPTGRPTDGTASPSSS